MYEQLKKEIESFERRTPMSRAALERSMPWMPLAHVDATWGLQQFPQLRTLSVVH